MPIPSTDLDRILERMRAHRHQIIDYFMSFGLSREAAITLYRLLDADAD